MIPTCWLKFSCFHTVTPINSYFYLFAFVFEDWRLCARNSRRMVRLFVFSSSTVVLELHQPTQKICLVLFLSQSTRITARNRYGEISSRVPRMTFLFSTGQYQELLLFAVFVSNQLLFELRLVLCCIVHLHCFTGYVSLPFS